MSITMYAGRPVGPAFVANAIQVRAKDEATKIEYHLALYPDMFNAQLREEKKEMWFYYIPDSPRLAINDQGNWMFHFSRFFGIADESTTIGVNTPLETAGGILAFTSTLQIPENVIAQAVAAIKGSGSQDKLFAWADGLPAPRIGSVPITAAESVISNIGAAAAGDTPDPALGKAWSWKMLGEGKSSTGPTGRNAYTGVLGPFAAAAIEAAFKGQSSPVFVHTNLKHKFWTTPIQIKMTGEWENIFTHLSAAFKGNIFSIKSDLQGEFNRMVSKNTIKRELFIDGEQVGAERVKEIETRAQIFLDKFVAAAEKAIFAPAPQVEAAQAAENKGFLGLFPGKSLSLKARHDITRGSFSYDETINQTFLWENVISAHMKGFFDEISADPANKAKYFSEVDVGSAFRKVRVFARCNANWGEEGQPGDPIASLGVGVGYTNREGVLETQTAARFSTPANPQPSPNTASASWTKETKDRVYIFDFAQNPALGERANEITVLETISFRESPQVEVDSLETTRVTNQHSIEVRADSLGGLAVGPIRFDRDISSEQIVFEVSFRTGTRPQETLRFDLKNKDTERFWKVWTKQVPGGVPWQYKVKVTVKGKTFTQPALVWEGDWKDHVGSRELMAEIPNPPAEIEAKITEYLT